MTNEQLLARCAAVIDDQEVRCYETDDGGWEAISNDGKTVARAIFAEIKAAGFVIVERERYDRLRHVAQRWLEWHSEFDPPAGVALVAAGLLPGDLDPLDGDE